MKKIGSIKMHDADLMSNDEMKRIVGGDLPTTTFICSTTCRDGSKVEIRCGDGGCIVEEGRYVMCRGTNHSLLKYCPDFIPID